MRVRSLDNIFIVYGYMCLILRHIIAKSRFYKTAHKLRSLMDWQIEIVTNNHFLRSWLCYFILKECITYASIVI